MYVCACLGQCVIYWKIYAFDVSSFVTSKIGFRWNKVEWPEQQPKREKTVKRAATTAVTSVATINNHFEMLALKHYKAFQFIQIKWDCFYFSCRLPKNKRNYYWILFCLLIYFCIRVFFCIFLLYAISLHLNIVISLCCRS